MGHLTVLGFEIAILEMRYVDDYLALWKGSPSIPDIVADRISGLLQYRMRQRYPLAFEDDSSGVFIGLSFDLGGMGAVSVSPSSAHRLEGDDADFGHLMPFESFAPPAHKRSVVLGAVARINSLTHPEALKPDVLEKVLCDLCRRSHFPMKLILKWISKSRFYLLPWVPALLRKLRL